MSGEEEDIRLPGDQTLVSTVLVTTVLVSTVVTTMVAPVTTASTTLPALPGYHLPDLRGLWSHVTGACRKMGGAYQWSMIYSNTQELWSLILKLDRESRPTIPALAPVPGPLEIIPKGLLDARFDGTPKKLAFFVVQVEKFLNAWGHLFLSKTRMVDYFTAQLWGGVADWYVSLHQVRGPKLQDVDAFMWALRVKYEDPLESERAQNYLCTLKQGKCTM
ncbi:UNVERIFIED_CONTAM: hypothetical protein K2H54_009070 [Gekko kuhli]